MIVGDKREAVEVINLVLAYATAASPPPPILTAGNVNSGGGGGNSNGSSSEHLNTTTGSSSPESNGSSRGIVLAEKLVDAATATAAHDANGEGVKGSILRATLGGLAICEPGNKCGKCQNHEIETSKKGHARDCPFKKCNCLKCRLLDARSDILQVISGKETKLKGTKKDPNCGFCQNHNIKILRKGHVRSCGFGQERHFRLDNCFDCEVHYIRNEVNRLQIKMRRAMKEDRTLTEEQRKTAREAITRDEVEKVCNLARLARKKRENILTQQAGSGQEQHQHSGNSLLAAPPSGGQLPVAQQTQQAKQQQQASTSAYHQHHQLAADPHKHNYHHHQNHLLNNQQHGFGQTPIARQVTAGDVWRPWSQHHQRQVALAQHQHQHHHHHPYQHQHQQVMNLVNSQSVAELQAIQLHPSPHVANLHLGRQQHQYLSNGNHYQHEPEELGEEGGEEEEEELEEADRDLDSTNLSRSSSSNNDNIDVVQQLSPPSTPPSTLLRRSTAPTLISTTSFANSLVLPNATTLNLAAACDQQQHHQANGGGLALTQQRNLQEQQLFNTLFRLIVAQFAQSTAANVGGH